MASLITFNYTGGASNADPELSLGGVGSSVNLVGTAINNLFENVLPPDILSTASVRYRAIDLYNDGDATAEAMTFFLLDTPNSQSLVEAWYDSTGTQSIIDEETEPTGATGNWTTPLQASQMALSNLAAAGNHRIWIKRTVNQTADNLANDTAYLYSWFA